MKCKYKPWTSGDDVMSYSPTVEDIDVGSGNLLMVVTSVVPDLIHVGEKISMILFISVTLLGNPSRHFNAWDKLNMIN